MGNHHWLPSRSDEMTTTWEKAQCGNWSISRKGYGQGDVAATIAFSILENGKTRSYQVDLSQEDRRMIERLMKD